MRRGRTILSEKQSGTDEEAELLVRVRLSLGVKGGGLLRLFFRGFSLRHSRALQQLPRRAWMRHGATGVHGSNRYRSLAACASERTSAKCLVKCSALY